MDAHEMVILVDRNDNEEGLMDKLEAHRKGLLHRAFSVFVFNDQHELLLQKRAFGKYHSGGLWTNTCCSHPRMGEPLVAAAHRRLKEEMGFDCNLQHIFQFIYEASLDNDLIENELDHVFVGYYKEDPVINPEEVADWKYAGFEEIEKAMADKPESFTVWFKIAFNKVKSYVMQNHSVK